MRTLLIDDMREIQADVVARNYATGIKALELMGPFDILLLDHDLGSEEPKETGYGIMCFLEENTEYLPKEIIIVSSNPVGRENIQRVIDSLKRRGLLK